MNPRSPSPLSFSPVPFRLAPQLIAAFAVFPFPFLVWQNPFRFSPYIYQNIYRSKGKAYRELPMAIFPRMSFQRSKGSEFPPLLLLGSPPRMRGKGPLCYHLFLSAGITPAYAGKSGGRPRAREGSRDHPRVCGEKTQKACNRILREGSPPRMRGKDGACAVSPGLCGITPAYAGKSIRAIPTMTATRDHPRVCGEKERLEAAGYPVVGSPPRMRGKAVTGMPPPVFSGITPAYAGKSPPA